MVLVEQEVPARAGISICLAPEGTGKMPIHLQTVSAGLAALAALHQVVEVEEQEVHTTQAARPETHMVAPAVAADAPPTLVSMDRAAGVVGMQKRSLLLHPVPTITS